MKSSYSSNLVDLMSQSKHYENHRKKIQNIMNKETNPNDFKRMHTLHTLQNFKLKAVSHILKEKQSTVFKQNDLIFQKILKVNKRKNQSLNPLNTTRSFSHKNLSNFKKTLNTITNQNNSLAQKLVTTRSNLSQQKLMSNYRRHLQVKQRLAKYEYDEDFGVIPKKLKSLQKIKFLKTNFPRSEYGNSSKFIHNRSSIPENQQQR